MVVLDISLVLILGLLVVIYQLFLLLLGLFGKDFFDLALLLGVDSPAQVEVPDDDLEEGREDDEKDEHVLKILVREARVDVDYVSELIENTDYARPKEFEKLKQHLEVLENLVTHALLGLNELDEWVGFRFFEKGNRAGVLGDVREGDQARVEIDEDLVNIDRVVIVGPESLQEYDPVMRF